MRNVPWNVAAFAAATAAAVVVAGDDGRLLISAARNGFSFGPLRRLSCSPLLSRSLLLLG